MTNVSYNDISRKRNTDFLHDGSRVSIPHRRSGNPILQAGEWAFRHPGDGRKWRERCRLKRQILRGYCKIGFAASESQLSSFLHVPRSSVRRVIGWLKAQGFLTNVKRCGYNGPILRQLHPEILNTGTARFQCERPTQVQCERVKSPKRKAPKKRFIETIERLAPPACANPENSNSRGTNQLGQMPDWEGELGIEIPDADLDAILRTMNSKYYGRTDGILGEWAPAGRSLYRYMVEIIFKRATRPERYWKAFYATALHNLVTSERGFHSAYEEWKKREARRAKYAPLYEAPEVSEEHFQKYFAFNAVSGEGAERTTNVFRMVRECDMERAARVNRR
jgi:hypothetical protein